MADQIIANLSSLGMFEPAAAGHGPKGKCAFNGGYHADLIEVNPTKHQEKGPGLNFVCKVAAEEGEDAGKVLYKTIYVEGMTKGQKPRPKSDDLGYALMSAGYTKEQVQSIGKSDGGNLDLAKVAAAFNKKGCWVTVTAEFYDGRVASNLDNFITQERFELMKKANQHRTPYNEMALIAAASVGTASVTGATPSVVAPTNGVTAPRALGI